MSDLSLGLVGNSRLENEKRLPLHPLQIRHLDEDLRRRVFLERGYGERFGIRDSQLEPFVAGLLPRERIMSECDAVVLFKPVLQDFLDLHEGQTLWGCPHFVQDTKATQVAIDHRLTVIAMESMYLRSPGTVFKTSIAPKVGEMAGFCSVHHALACIGRTGVYGRRLRAAIIGFGSTGQGAAAALDAQGIRDVTVLTRRPPVTVTGAPTWARRARLDVDDQGHMHVTTAMSREGLPEYLAGYDIVVNCVRQDPAAPMIFLDEDDLADFTPGSLIIDVSADHGMGFSWARPTTFTEPVRHIRETVQYYAVNHSPSYLWDSATWILGEALMPYIGLVASGEEAWRADEVLSEAMDIHHGVIRDPSIISYQHRSSEYPHSVA